ncbi:FAD binding domain protein [Talaromyces proteolyticus]|uniref:FAD binding domain protein n=1 Tax=Talaromyces proteolyticus TaxID=1131652 RepID=A0AAD4PU73_9EURO|nr:FAD binding domain protein [Talaromyces proteolyticus]KAH8694268.1 FAD binding domain protein [Talaromyces proteolyticus]
MVSALAAAIVLGLGLFNGVDAQLTTAAEIKQALQANGLDVSKLPSTSQNGIAAASGINAAPQHCNVLCSVLAGFFPDQTITSQESQLFANWTGSFWSQQQEATTPRCIFQPSSSIEVSSGLLLAQLFTCPFAIKSGGHAAFSGSSSVQNGLNIDLSKLNAITLNKDHSVASIGAGNRWVDVYNYLQPYNISVVGGRVSDIGVGGLTTGGGISFFSQIYGWACDNVVNYQVVLASGAVVNVNPSSNPDLYWALRGGGNNFAIVTRFDLSTHSQGSLWSGSLIYTPDKSTQMIDIFYNYGVNAASDPKSAVIMNWAYAEGLFLSVADLEYADSTVNPPIFQNFTNVSTLENTMAVRTLPEVTEMFKQSNPNGLRESYWTATFTLTKDMITFLVNTFEEESSRAVNATGYTPALVLQIISTDVLTQMQKNGGNALGLSPSDGTLLLLNLSFMWGDIADDNLILDILGSITSKAIAYGKANGLYKEYLYMNYASQYQAVLPSYGSANFARLQSVSKKYDPLQVFQRLEPGYFKLTEQPPNATYPSSS